MQEGPTREFMRGSGSTSIERSPATPNGVDTSSYVLYLHRLGTILLLRPRGYQIRVPRSFGTAVLQRSPQTGNWRFGVWKFRHQIRMDPYDGFLPMPQLRTVFDGDAGKTSIKDP